MLRRRRPLLRAAIVGGAGYMAGKMLAGQEQHEAEQDELLGQVQQPSQASAQAESVGDTASQRIEALTKLKSLFDAGVLTQQEFDAEKSKLLEGD